MRIKSQFLGVVILILIFTLNTFSLLAYEIGMPSDEYLGWKCYVYNEKVLNSTLGDDWKNFDIFENMQQDRYLYWYILNRKIDDTFLNLTISKWDWGFGCIPGDFIENKSYWYYLDPSQYPDNYNFTETFPFINWWLPIPMSDYVGKLNLNNIYDIDDRVLFTINVKIGQNYLSNGSPSKTINIIAMYDEVGFLNLLKITLPGNKVLLDIRSIKIPIFSIPVLISLFIALIGFLVFYLKKMRKHKER